MHSKFQAQIFGPCGETGVQLQPQQMYVAQREAMIMQQPYPRDHSGALTVIFRAELGPARQSITPVPETACIS